ncbi:MAG: hypothetical protein KDD10_15000 [Phaeodactylibacter sp.]|nr:hypothetical protein [Phaeodactylibacter sp.]MCB9296531.1 hypothetical protein [Lewinellaceae bacterium]
MLTKLVLINSSSYKIAELNFEGSRSLQLVGPNNVGKSSLIYALNFVFLVNKKLMNFSGQRPADKETIAHYFPDAERSYIVFEVSKRGRRYCVLVRRDGEAELHYARLETAYRKDLFFEPTAKGQKLRNYRELARHLISERQVRLKELPQATDVLRQIYHTGKGNNAAVWLTPKCKSSGTTNSFTKVYRYLINSKLVTNRALKDILLIADNRDQDQLSYSRQNMQDIDRLRRESQKLAILRSIEEEFRQFRLLTGEVQEVYDNLARQFRLYRQAATALAAELADKIYHKEKEAGELKLQARELEQQKGEQNQEVGILRHRMQSLREKIRQEEQTQKAIQALPPLPLLQQQLQSAREALEKLSYRLQEARGSGKSPEELERRQQRLQNSIGNKRRELANSENWLINHLADEAEDIKLLNSILRPELGHLPKSAIRRKATKAARRVQLFDGEIQLPDDFKLQPLATPEELAAEIADLESEQARISQLLEAIRNRAALEKQRAEALEQQKKLEDDIGLASRMDQVGQEIKRLKKELDKLAGEKEKTEKKLRQLAEAIERLDTGRQVLQEQMAALRQDEANLRRDQRELEGMDLEHFVLEKEVEGGAKDARSLYQDIRQNYDKYKKLAEQKSRLFNQLRNKAQYDLADEKRFINALEQELKSLQDKEQSIETLLSNIAVQFANPAQKFLDGYEEFRTFIVNEFNYQLGRVRISNIESLKVELEPNERLQKDLRKIAGLTLNAQTLFGQGEASNGHFEILREYLERGQAVPFNELFDLRLRLTVNGKARSVNLARQVESDGTDRMLRLIIIMTVINRLTVRSPENRIVLFIDEIATIDSKNRPQLVQYCQDNHYYPIFAAPDMVDGFDRYAIIRRGTSGKIVIDEKIHLIERQAKHDPTEEVLSEN